MKFGGTSVEDPAAINRTASIVAGRVAAGKQTVVVVSAMAKVTDQLLRAAAAAAKGDRTGALAISSRLRARHRDTACALIKTPADSAALCNLIEQKFDSLDEILRGLAAILELTPRISDLVVSYGERLSSRIIAAAFASAASTPPTSTRAKSSSPTRNSAKPFPSTCSSRNAPPSSSARCSNEARCP